MEKENLKEPKKVTSYHISDIVKFPFCPKCGEKKLAQVPCSMYCYCTYCKVEPRTGEGVVK